MTFDIDAVDALEFTENTGKRAVYEEYEFRPLGGGDVEVENLSHGDADDGEDHSYVVHVVGGLPSDCECPADEYHEGACKHRVALAMRPALLEVSEAGQETPALATDGGQEELPEHLTRMSTIDGDDVVHCQSCGGEGGSPDSVDHYEQCPEVAEREAEA